MKMFSGSKLWKRAMFGLMLLLPYYSHAQTPNPDMQITNIHRTLASQTGWLNTSRALTPEDLQGRIILLDFWTFCCINCIHVIPDLKYLEEKFGDDLTVIGVHSAKFKNERDTDNIRNAILRYGIHHPVVNDFDFSIWQRFGVRAWPTFMLINPKGIVEATYSGEGNREEAERDIAALIAKYPERNKSTLPIALEASKQPESVLKFPGKMTYKTPFQGTDDIGRGQGVFFISDSGHHRLVAIDESGKVLFTVGSGKEGLKDGTFEDAQFSSPQGLLYETRTPLSHGLKNSAVREDYLYVADTGNHVIRRISFLDKTVTTIAGTGRQGYERRASNAPALQTPLASPWDLAFYPDNTHIAIAMAGTHQLWSYDIEAETVSVLAGNGRESIDDGKLPFNSLSQPSGLSAHDGKLYFVDSETSSLRVLENGEITTLIGTGLFDFGYKEGKQGQALMQHALGLYADATGVYIADSYNHSIRRYDTGTKTLTDFAGHGVRGKEDGLSSTASFNEPNDVLMLGNKLYVADTNNHALRIIDTMSGNVSTLAITAAPVAQTVEFAAAGQLPNLEAIPALTLTPGKATSVEIGLKPGWKINADAPSYLALFTTDSTPKPLQVFSLEEVKKKRITLPALENGSYRLQGTLYYCEDKEGAQCLIKSFDAVLNAAKTPATLALNHLSLKLN